MTAARTIAALLAVATLLPMGCTNRLRGTGAQTALNTTTGVFGTGGTGITSFVTLSKVVPSTSAPTQSLDLVGDGTNTIGKFCTASTGDTLSSGIGASTCQCVFSYDESGVANEFEVDTVYHESNLIRCDYNEVPAEIEKFEVKIHVLTADVFSNVITFNRAAAGLDSDDILDLESPTSFIEVRKFQCREMLTSAFLWDAETVGSAVKIYDPFQSERPALNYPLNFYSGNPGMSLLNLVAASAQDADFYKNWDCSHDPITQAPWENQVVYSESSLPCTDSTYCQETCTDEKCDLELYGFSDEYVDYYKEELNWDNDWDENDTDAGASKFSVDYLIHHPDPKIRLPRSTFFLARKETGVFNVPVNAALGPGQGLLSFTGADPTDATTPAPLGFAARPNYSQPGEPCPTEEQVKIPEGYHWVKVWAFRGTLSPRSGVSNAKALIRNPRISCDPGNFDSAVKSFGSSEAEVRDPAFVDCRDPDTILVGSGDLTGDPNGLNTTVPPKLKAFTPFRLQDSETEDGEDDAKFEHVPAPNFACNEHRDSDSGDANTNWECEVPRGADANGDGRGDDALAARVIEFFGGGDMLCVRFPRFEDGNAGTGDTGGLVASCGGWVAATLTSLEKQILADSDRGPDAEGQAKAGQANICSASADFYPGMDWWMRDGNGGVDDEGQQIVGNGYQNPQGDVACDTTAFLAGSLDLGDGGAIDTWNSCHTNYFQFVDGIGGGTPELESTEEEEDRTGWNLDLAELRPTEFPGRGNVPLQTAENSTINGTGDDETDPSEEAFTLAAFDGEDRYDFLYVVSPAVDVEPGSQRFLKNSIKTKLGDTYEYYLPYTFKHNESCTVDNDNGLPIIDGSLRVHDDPENGNGDNCSNYSTKRINFDFIEHGVGVPASDADPGNPEGNVYPVCAIQPDDLRTLYLPRAF